MFGVGFGMLEVGSGLGWGGLEQKSGRIKRFNSIVLRKQTGENE